MQTLPSHIWVLSSANPYLQAGSCSPSPIQSAGGQRGRGSAHTQPLDSEWEWGGGSGSSTDTHGQVLFIREWPFSFSTGLWPPYMMVGARQRAPIKSQSPVCSLQSPCHCQLLHTCPGGTSGSQGPGPPTRDRTPAQGLWGRKLKQPKHLRIGCCGNTRSWLREASGPHTHMLTHTLSTGTNMWPWNLAQSVNLRGLAIKDTKQRSPDWNVASGQNTDQIPAAQGPVTQEAPDTLKGLVHTTQNLSEVHKTQ